jgi:hypothetical protein
MMGRREVGQGQFFYEFDLDKAVPPDHLVRQIDGVLLALGTEPRMGVKRSPLSERPMSESGQTR